MKTLYKYASIETAKEILKNNSIAFTAPSQFNDPYDCDLYVSPEELEKCYALREEYELMQYLLNLLNTLTKPKDRAILLIYKTIIELQKFFMQKNPIYDPNWMLLFLIRKIGKYADINAGKEIYKKKTLEQLDNVRNNFYVSCFSEKNDSILMWGHYADKFKGVCIEWQIPTEERFIENVKYSVRKPKFRVYNLMKKCLGYMFLGKEVDLNDRKIRKYIFDRIITKGDDWKYEKEIRWILDKNILSSSDVVCINEEKKQIIYTLPNVPCHVYIGAKTLETDEKQIREFCKQYPNCKVIKSCISNQKYKVLVSDKQL